jgi:cytochrome c551/c552
MESSDCETCHKLDEKSIGPSFKQVAEKYKSDPAAPDYLANKIIKGGGGVWGETAMSAHPTITSGEAHQIVEWIMSQSADAKKPASLPLTGSIDPTVGNPLKDKGVFYLLASYTDKGGAGIKPITGTAGIELYNSKLPAGEYDKADGVSTYTAEGMKLLIPAASTEGWAAYKDLDLSDVNGIEVIYFTPQTPQYGYVAEALLDNLQGAKLGEVTIGPGAKPGAPNTASISFTPITDGKQHTLYFRIKAADPAEQAPLGIGYWQLLSK